MTKFLSRSGGITGSRYLSGFGPGINIKIIPVGNVVTNLKSEFNAAGINQTLHRIYLELACTVTIVTPYDTIEANIKNQILY